MFADVLKKNIWPDSICGRIGGDEFIVFAPRILSEEELARFSSQINTDYLAGIREIMGSHLQIPIGVSIGAVAVPEYGRNYPTLFRLADQALYFVKQNGKHGYRLFNQKHHDSEHHYLDLESITSIMEERRESSCAMWLGEEVFGSIYRYMVHYMERYHSIAYRVLMTVNITEDVDAIEYAEIMMQFKNSMQHSLRSSDVMMECGENQVFLLLPEVQEYDIDHVIKRLIARWKTSEYADKTEVIYESGKVHQKKQTDQPGQASTVVVVDDDETNLRIASGILSRQGMQVTTFRSGQELLRYVKTNTPQLILLDIHMPEMDGIETLQQLRRVSVTVREIPVIFLTADENYDCEAKCLELGAMDFIKKPFVPDVLVLRVRQTIELVQLQRNLAAAVERKTRENESLSLHLVYTLADAIDAKNAYTRGHSTRVAAYAKEIARRYGYGKKDQDEIYMTAMLHDVGKIGVPNVVIEKQGKLTEEEYALIKMHPVVGGRILQNIVEMPKLSEGARYHHEWYDGRGYPEGLSGENIPEQARIIAVADAYDAMSSRRSYRSILTQVYIRNEIETGKGTQFDPRFADIMLEMIDEDTDFKMREQ